MMRHKPEPRFIPKNMDLEIRGSFTLKKISKNIVPRGVFRGGGLLGLIAAPCPGPVKSIDFREFSCPNGC